MPSVWPRVWHIKRLRQTSNIFLSNQRSNRFTCLPETTRNQNQNKTKTRNKQQKRNKTTRHWSSTMKESDPWEMGKKWVEPCGYQIIEWRGFSGYCAGRAGESQAAPHSFPQLEMQEWLSREVKAAIACRAEHQAEKQAQEIFTGSLLSIHVCMSENYPSLEKEPPTKLIRNNPAIQKGRNSACY